MNTRNCECCHGEYATGKSYGDFWEELPNPTKEIKGLCEFCNPNDTKWFVKEMRCHFKIKLPTVTLIAVTGKNVEAHKEAIAKSCEGIEFGAVKLIENPSKDINEWNHKILYNLTDYIDTDFALLIHDDSWVINPDVWTDEFLNFDYIGAPWPEGSQPERVGNGGFSLRSKKLLDAFNVLNLPFTDNGTGYFNEDGQICVYHRKALEEYGIKFAPVELAARFSRELPCAETVEKSFGFHKYL